MRARLRTPTGEHRIWITLGDSDGNEIYDEWKAAIASIPGVPGRW
jgi:hypothetical protein